MLLLYLWLFQVVVNVSHLILHIVLFRNLEEGSHTSDERGEAVIYVLQVAAHLLLYARNLAGQTAPDQRNVQPLFRPSMATQHSHTHSIGTLIPTNFYCTFEIKCFELLLRDIHVNIIYSR